MPDTAKPSPGGHIADGELLFEWRGRWRVAGGEVTEPIDSPIAGIVREVDAGTRIVVRATGQALRGIVALGGPTRGALHVASWVEGELRGGSVDVGLAGKVLVVGSRIDAETLTRARAMGVKRDHRGRSGQQGTARLPGLRRHASERRSTVCRRSRSWCWRAPSDGRWPVRSWTSSTPSRGATSRSWPIRRCSSSTSPSSSCRRPARTTSASAPGSCPGARGRGPGCVGPRRFSGGVHLEAGTVRFDDGSVVAVPLGDLERFA